MNHQNTSTSSKSSFCHGHERSLWTRKGPLSMTRSSWYQANSELLLPNTVVAWVFLLPSEMGRPKSQPAIQATATSSEIKATSTRHTSHPPLSPHISRLWSRRWRRFIHLWQAWHKAISSLTNNPGGLPLYGRRVLLGWATFFSSGFFCFFSSFLFRKRC